MAADPLSIKFAALADPTRRAILARLAQGVTTVNELAKPFDMGLPAVSKHLKVLEQAGLIRSRRAARNVIYSVDTAGIGKTLGYLLNDCCCDHPEVRAACTHGTPTLTDQGALAGTVKT